jgi:hypothetical protein
MSLEFEQAVFRKFVPVEAVAYCHQLYSQGDFKIRIVNGRISRLGDFRYDRDIGEYVISVNNNLNPYAFLITYIHEVAHYRTYLKHRHLVKPHGKEWKQIFQQLMAPMIRNEVFPDDLKHSLMRHLRNPKAATCSDPVLYALLRKHDHQSTDFQLLRQLKPGDQFRFKDRVFRKEMKRRTRALCFELKTGKTYLIPEIAEVEKMD